MSNPSQFHSDSVFWIEIEKIKPNPYQPRREFDDDKLRDLAESIRMYGVLQPLIVTRHEFEKPDGGIAVEYEHRDSLSSHRYQYLFVVGTMIHE